MAAERGLAFSEGDWLFEITRRRSETSAPVLIVADYSTVTAAFLHHLRDVCPSLRLVLGWCGAPYLDGSVFGACDIVLSCVPELVAHFRQQGHRSQHINHAFEPRILDKLDTTAAPNADFVFLGSIIKSDQFHLEREKILARLVDETDLLIWSEVGQRLQLRRQGDAPERGSTGSNERVTVRTGIRARVASLPLLAGVARRASRILRGGSATPAPAPSVDESIARRARPSLFGLEMFQQLHDSRVALNTHIDISPVNASNMRLFEATGVGTCC